CEVLDVTLEYLFGTGEREKFGVVEDFPNEEIAKLMEYLNKSGDLAKMIEALRTGGEAGLEEYMLGLEARLKAEMEIQAIEHAAFDIKPVQPLSLNALNLPIRAYNCLTRSGFRDAEEVAEAIRSDPKRMAKTRNLGRTSYQDIIDSLVKAGLLTKGEALPWSTIARLKGY
ncbi:MAG: hypothetical protein LUG99_22620, partial [Lachnospiraceae bacterium]|nr:hypothetical protein [Lachnospiraceae bacterium]